MGLMEWLGLGGPPGPPVPAAVVAGASGSGRKSLINRVLEGWDEGTKACVVLYDVHHAEQQILQAPRVCVHPYVHQAIKCRCHGEGSEPVRKSVSRAARRHRPDAIILQVGRGKNAREVLKDILRIKAYVRLAAMTAVLNAESALNDLRDPEDDIASYVRAAGQVLITHADTAPAWAVEGVRNRVRELNPKAVVVDDIAAAAATIRGQVEGARSSAAGVG